MQSEIKKKHVYENFSCGIIKKP